MSALEVDVREATAADEAELGRIARLAIDELAPSRGGSVWARREGAWLAAVGQNGDRPTPWDIDVVLVGTLDGLVVGAAALEVQPLGDALLAVLRGIYVEQEARELGVGERLMEEVLGRAAAAGCEGVDSFVLPGNRDAKNFFEAHGLVARGIVVHHRLPGRDP
jgi:ribosomal protein S18 acetylase RimI-like enzyme